MYELEIQMNGDPIKERTETQPFRGESVLCSTLQKNFRMMSYYVLHCLRYN